MTAGPSAPGMREEQAAFAPVPILDEEMFDVVNLTRRDTGIAGIIFVSTAMGQHGPRVKWFPERASRDGPCLIVTIGADPKVMVQGLPAAQANSAAAALRAWVQANEAALLRFWHDGLTWTRDEVNAFFDSLAKADQG